MQTVTVNLDTLQTLIKGLEASVNAGIKVHQNKDNQYDRTMLNYFEGQKDAYKYITSYLKDCSKYEV